LKVRGRCENAQPLDDYLFWTCLGALRKLDVPLAIHSGMWGDFRQSQPTWIIPWAAQFPEIRFDLFHLGYPYPHEAAIIAKNFSNVYLNLCWCPIVSQRLTQNMLDEIIDLVPMNKIIAFGGDYRVIVQKVYGHLVMAREIVSRVLGGRVANGELTEERAMEIAELWFCENPTQLYRL